MSRRLERGICRDVTKGDELNCTKPDIDCAIACLSYVHEWYETRHTIACGREANTKTRFPFTQDLPRS